MARSVEVKRIHSYAWLWEPLQDDASFVLKSMFGAKAAYLGGKLVLGFTDGEEPWHGVLVCTGHIHHASLVQEFPALAPHPILPKWLYLSDAHPAFESTAQKLVRIVRQRDPRIGVEPGTRKRKAAKKTVRRRSA